MKKYILLLIVIAFVGNVKAQTITTVPDIWKHLDWNYYIQAPTDTFHIPDSLRSFSKPLKEPIFIEWYDGNSIEREEPTFEEILDELITTQQQILKKLELIRKNDDLIDSLLKKYK